MTLNLPDNIPGLRQMSEAALKTELALALYAGRKLTLIQAADVAGVVFFEFQALLSDRRIPQHYDANDLEQDLLTIRELDKR
jgi:predicted HTH domain antitoxin